MIFLNIRIIQLNEGTFFTSTLKNLGLSGEAEVNAFKGFINGLVIDNSTLTSDVVDKLVSFYPANDPSLGAPFNTGDSLYDRSAAWYTDQNFLSVRRSFFQRASSLQPMYAYYFTEFIPGNDITVGGMLTLLFTLHKIIDEYNSFLTHTVTHQSELELFFGPIPPAASVEKDFANTMRDFYINFVNDLRPGGTYTRARTYILTFVKFMMYGLYLCILIYSCLACLYASIPARPTAYEE